MLCHLHSLRNALEALSLAAARRPSSSQLHSIDRIGLAKFGAGLPRELSSPLERPPIAHSFCLSVCLSHTHSLTASPRLARSSTSARLDAFLFVSGAHKGWCCRFPIACNKFGLCGQQVGCHLIAPSITRRVTWLVDSMDKECKALVLRHICSTRASNHWAHKLRNATSHQSNLLQSFLYNIVHLFLSIVTKPGGWMWRHSSNRKIEIVN